MILSKEHQKTLIGPQNWNCRTCSKQVIKDYCRACDEFFYFCDCNSDHKDHRVYLTGFKCPECKCAGGCCCCKPGYCGCKINNFEMDQML
jgi:hypothetical protein